MSYDLNLTTEGSIAALLFYLAIWIAVMSICGVLCKKLAAKKGYTGYFWTGFFLQIMGLIYVVGLPMAKDRCD